MLLWQIGRLSRRAMFEPRPKAAPRPGSATRLGRWLATILRRAYLPLPFLGANRPA
jgi:hypothetical protein